ncbi:MAG: HD domain-containing protein [Deltaproteobacteria bacterium]|nr:HD domain-containing protein [Deltaproteobacteria bacterium]
MNELLDRLKKEARVLSKAQTTALTAQFAPEIRYSRELFSNHPLVLRCREDVCPFLNDKYGHGVRHARKVAIDAGALIMVETQGWDLKIARRLALLAQLAALCHDICRFEPDHALRGASLTRRILSGYPLNLGELEAIVFAIENHEAFQPMTETRDETCSLLAGALYDADKFRWGPDNFSTTLWEICDYEEWSLAQILERMPKGLRFIESVAETFRTRTGRIYGPEYIEIGLNIGRRLYARLLELNRQTAGSPA